MKLLFISAVFPPTAAPEADHALHLCQRLADHGLDVHVLTTKKDVVANGSSFRVHPVMPNWSWSQLPRLARFIRHYSPDVILLHYIGWIYDYHPMMTFAPTIAKAALSRARFVTQFTNAMGAIFNQETRLTAIAAGHEKARTEACFNPESRLERAIHKGVILWAGEKHTSQPFGTLLRDSDRIIVFSDNHRATLADHFLGVKDKSVLIPPPPIMPMSENNGMTRQRGRDNLAAKPEELLITYFGYVYAGKGIETLLKAFQLVKGRSSNVRLVIVGRVADAKFYELPKELAIEDKVTWTGDYQWDSDEGSVYLRAADICVLPLDTGVQLNNSSFAAAAAHGLPIITTRSEMLEEPFVDQENVFLCPPKDPEAMAAAIETLMARPDLRERLRAGALQLADEWFSWETATDRTLATFTKA